MLMAVRLLHKEAKIEGKLGGKPAIMPYKDLINKVKETILMIKGTR